MTPRVRFRKGQRVIDRRTGEKATVLATIKGAKGSDGYGLAIVYDSEPDTAVSTGTDYFIPARRRSVRT